MFLVREVMHCKPGKVKEMLDKFRGVSAVMTKMGMKPFRMYTDVSGEQFWTVVGELEVEKLDTIMRDMEKVMSNEEARKAMAGYHDLVIEGRREIYQIEG